LSHIPKGNLRKHLTSTQGCPLGGLTHEHQKGRALVAELEQAAQSYFKQPTPDVQAEMVWCLRDLVKGRPKRFFRRLREGASGLQPARWAGNVCS
jgi:hypothetical protein